MIAWATREGPRPSKATRLLLGGAEGGRVSHVLPGKCWKIAEETPLWHHGDDGRREEEDKLPRAHLRRDSELTHPGPPHPFYTAAEDPHGTGPLAATNQVPATNLNTIFLYSALPQSYRNKGCWPGYRPSQSAAWWAWETGCCSNPRGARRRADSVPLGPQQVTNSTGRGAAVGATLLVRPPSRTLALAWTPSTLACTVPPAWPRTLSGKVHGHACRRAHQARQDQRRSRSSRCYPKWSTVPRKIGLSGI